MVLYSDMTFNDVSLLAMRKNISTNWRKKYKEISIAVAGITIKSIKASKYFGILG